MEEGTNTSGLYEVCFTAYIGNKNRFLTFIKEVETLEEAENTKLRYSKFSNFWKFLSPAILFSITVDKPE